MDSSALSPTFSLVVTDAYKAVLWNLLLRAAAGGQLIQIVVHLPEALGHTLGCEPSLRVLIPAFVDGGAHQSHPLQEITFRLLKFSTETRQNCFFLIFCSMTYNLICWMFNAKKIIKKIQNYKTSAEKMNHLVTKK